MGVERATVTVWKKLGRIVMSAGAVDIELSMARLETMRDSRRPRNAGRKPAERPTSPAPSAEPADWVLEGDESNAQAAERMAEVNAGESFDTSKARKERYAGLLNQLEYDQKSGLVVAVADVAAAVGAQLATVRTKLMAIPAEQAPRLARIKTASEMQDALLEVIVDALSELVADATA